MVSKDDIITARATMAQWKDYRGFTPFGGSDSAGAEDRVAPLLSQATSMLAMLSAACNDEQALRSKGEASEFSECSARLLSGTLEGVSTLIELAAFMLED